ncbi:UDP-glucose 4-epimerase GalE [Halomonas campisalis]|uniref:UDP-glucose 4-epimerase n=1 Tax=Billgrantia campisalis TaxID=74661 RepID=A0ABS9PDB1_9GAMM|nr:UDP-glucose 4-epimerase GalE [Halomonas campisalis]MCG6659757.1 UDP-glucose 4-epimerase GalE [Halomonas campisalis]MDR5864913.1 UDP-glucose 4-epimerase GalE [Halomonas campisalis]
MRVLVTGGAGYIGSHAVLELLEAGHQVVVLDNLCNGSAEALTRVESLAGKPLAFCQGDVRDRALLDALFADHAIEAVMHFAGLKAVGESVERPLAYYDNNVHGTLVLCQAMAAAGVYRLVFSSSATVYGAGAPVPYVETLPRGTTANPYGTSKAMVETLLEDLQVADPRWSVVLLRYFNPIGAHPSGRIGEDPRGIPNNLMPFISQVAVGRREALEIFGSDYPTRDGTCERDYLHVVDLAQGHLLALERAGSPGVHVYNLGSGRACSVLKMVETFQRVTGRAVAYRFASRRAGDLPAFWADAGKAERELGWKARRGLDEMVADTWRWQSANPEGY